MAKNMEDLDDYNTLMNSTLNHIVDNILTCLNLYGNTSKFEDNAVEEFERQFQHLYNLLAKDRDVKR